jgi:hypothetical protein
VAAGSAANDDPRPQASGGWYLHAFHLSWIDEIGGALNSGNLPPNYCALAEQHAGRLEPDVLTLRGRSGSLPVPHPPEGPVPCGLMVGPPCIPIRAESDDEFYGRKHRTVVVRRVSGDHVVAMIVLVSPGSKDSHGAVRAFVD